MTPKNAERLLRLMERVADAMGLPPEPPPPRKPQQSAREFIRAIRREDGPHLVIPMQQRRSA